MAVGFWSLTAARVGVAVGEAAAMAASTTMIADVYPPEQRSRAMSVFSLGPHLGSLVGLGVEPGLPSTMVGVRPFLWLSVPGVLIALRAAQRSSRALCAARRKVVPWWYRNREVQ